MTNDMNTHEPIRFLDLAATHAEVRPALEEIWEETMNSNGFIGGNHLEAFESEFADYCQSTHCIGVANGTDALELILRGLSIQPGDEVIVPTNTFIATAEAVVNLGATPIFVDVDPLTALITAEHIRAAITPRTVAVMVVHLYGQMANMDEILAVTDAAGIALIEDSAQAHGATWNGKRAGSFGVAAGFSFYPGKNLGALGDGGAVTTSDADLAERVRSIANHGRSLESRYHHDIVGRNSRLDGLQAAALRIKLAELDRWNQQRRSVAKFYNAMLPERFVPYIEAPLAESVYHLFVVQTVDESRDVVGARLGDANIGWGIHYPVPCHRQKPFVTDTTPDFEVADTQAPLILSLPMHPHISEQEVERVCAVLDSDRLGHQKGE